MADDALAQIADAAHAVETNAEELATLLAAQGAEEASKLFSQCAKAAHEVVQQVPAAPGKQPEAEGAAEPGGDNPHEETVEQAAAAPPEGGGGGRTPYAGASASLQRDVKRKAKG